MDDLSVAGPIQLPPSDDGSRRSPAERKKERPKAPKPAPPPSPPAPGAKPVHEGVLDVLA